MPDMGRSGDLQLKAKTSVSIAFISVILPKIMCVDLYKIVLRLK